MPQEVIALPVLSSTIPSSPFSPSNLHLQTLQGIAFDKEGNSLNSIPGEQDDDYTFSTSPATSTMSSSSQRDVKIGTRFEKPPHSGPGASFYVPQPTRAELKANNGLFGSATRPYYYKDPSGKPFIDIDGRDCGPRWVRVDPRAHEHPTKSKNRNGACLVM